MFAITCAWISALRSLPLKRRNGLPRERKTLYAGFESKLATDIVYRRHNPFPVPSSFDSTSFPPTVPSQSHCGKDSEFRALLPGPGPNLKFHNSGRVPVNMKQARHIA